MMQNETDEMEQNAFIEMQNKIASVRSRAPQRLQDLYERINETNDRILNEKQYIVETEEFTIPDIKDPFDSCSSEELDIKQDTYLKKKIREQIQMIRVYLKIRQFGDQEQQ